MNITEAMNYRHSVRQYEDKELSKELTEQIQSEIDICNRKSGLHIQLVTDEPKAFDGFMAHYGKFSGVRNYIAMVGKKSSDLEEKCGYYGERLVLFLQMLGLNTCWVAMTYAKIPGAFSIEKGEKLIIVIALGYGKNQGVPHKSKALKELVASDNSNGEWFQNGMEAVMLAPTAVNQQKFKFSSMGSRVTVKPGFGPCTRIDMGIAKYHFEIGAGKKNFEWE